MKDFKKYLKNKLKKQSIIGKATLSPPDPVDSLQSSSSLAVLDLIGEGPIEGLVKKNGASVNPVTTLESLYLNKVPVKEPETFVYGTGNSKLLPYHAIKRVARLNKDTIPIVLDSISGRIADSVPTRTTGLSNGLFREKASVEYFLGDSTSDTAPDDDGDTNTHDVRFWDDGDSAWGTTGLITNYAARTIGTNKAERCVGLFYASVGGTYTFQTASDDVLVVWMGDATTNPATQTSGEGVAADVMSITNTNHIHKRTASDQGTDFDQSFTIDLAAGRMYPFCMGFGDHGGNSRYGIRVCHPNSDGSAQTSTNNGGDFEGMFFCNDKEPLPTSRSNIADHIMKNGNTLLSLMKPSLTGGTGQNVTPLNLLGDFTTYSEFSNEGLVNQKFDEISAFKTELIDFVETNSGLARFGMIEYDVSGLFNIDDNISGRMSINPTSAGNINSYMTTNFQFNHLFQQGTGGNREGGNFIKRQILDESDNTIDVPDGFVLAVPVFSSDESLNASGLGVGKVENMKRVETFSGGGVFFFDAGTGDNNAADDFHLRTGRYITDGSSASITGEFQKGTITGYDVFVSNISGISLERPSSKQITPAIGETAASLLKVGLISDLLSRFNYNQVAFSFRDGNEQQPVMDGYNTSSSVYESNAKLFGPLIYGTGANLGSGSGYSDVREAGGGDYSAWMINTPLESDAFPYTHIVQNGDVTACYPSIAIEQLFDTIEAGDDAGVQKDATLALRVEYGFEGDIGEPETVTVGAESVNVGALISGGNHPKNIALKQFKKTLDKQYTTLIQSPYMTTISELDDLPTNNSLKNLRIDANSIPGLTTEMLSDLGYTSGELLYPGDSWKDVNRYVKITKMSKETDSNLLTREVTATFFTEKISHPFVYPLSSLGATTFDARAFQTQPSREFDIRGKKVLIPSNYEPLNTDGTDKRFVDSSDNYGLRKLYTFNNASYGLVEEMINLGTENIKITVKANKRSDGNPDNYIFDMKSRDGTSANSGRIAIGNNNGEIFAIGKGGGNFYVTVDEGSLTASDVCEIELTIVGTSVNLKVTKLSDGSLVGESTGQYATSRPEIVFNPFATASSNFIIGASAVGFGGKMDSGGHIVDLKIYKNNQLLHWWDGTVIYSERHQAQVLRDKFGGAHAVLNGTINDELFEDVNFTFGKNKNIIYNGDWDGTFKLGWTDNPAWILYDLMINPTYGIGNNLDDREDINIFRLFELARFCDAVDKDGLFDGLPNSTKGLEPRFSCNIRLATSKNAFEVIGNIASVFRAITFWDGAFLNFTVDRPKKLAAIFNNGNVYDGIFNYGDITSASRFTRVEVPYSDAQDQFVTKYEYIEDEERMRRFGVITNQVNGVGCTSKSQARRLGKYIMLSNKLETELVSFEAGNEVLFLEPGDVVRIDDEVKNFEINYGKILEINTGSSPFFVIEDSVDRNSIEVGAGGGVYTYNNKQQTELETLYDIVNFDRIETFGNTGAFGVSGNNYEGKLPATAIEDHNVEQISRFYINSTADVTNGVKLNLDNTDSNFASITGVRTGSFFNVQLQNQISGEYKIVKISPRENNLYKVDAMQYERRKFDMIESEDFDLEENTHNIGIPVHTVNRPSAPTFGQDGPKYFYTPNNLLTVTGELVKAGGSDETSYRITLLKQNVSAPYVQKEFEAESDGITFFEINGLDGGNYILNVNSLRNPESSQALTYNFNIPYPEQVYIKTLFYDIEYENGMDLNFQRQSSIASGSGQHYGNDVTYKFNLKDKYNRDVSVSHLDYTINVYAQVSGEYKLVKTGHNEQSYTFSEAMNWATHGLESGAINKDYTLRFDLIQDSNIIDSGFCSTTII